MAAAVLSSLVAGTCAALAWRWRPAPARARSLAAATRRAGADPSGLDVVVAGLGRRLAGLAGLAPDASRDLRVGRTVVAALALLPLVPPASLAVVVGSYALPVARRRRRRRIEGAQVLSSLPSTVDLLRLAVASGHNVALAVEAVARRTDGPLADGLRRVVHRTDAGVRRADALDELADMLGEPVRPLVAVLVASDVHGVPVAESLARLSAELRVDRRRRAEAAARRLPVKLLFPLVTCSLPAFALLTVVPLVAASLGSLRL